MVVVSFDLRQLSACQKLIITAYTVAAMRLCAIVGTIRMSNDCDWRVVRGNSGIAGEKGDPTYIADNRIKFWFDQLEQGVCD